MLTFIICMLENNDINTANQFVPTTNDLTEKSEQTAETENLIRKAITDCQRE